MRINPYYRIVKIVILLVLLGIVVYTLLKGEESVGNETLLRTVFRLARIL